MAAVTLGSSILVPSISIFIMNLSAFCLASLKVGDANSAFLKYLDASSFGIRPVAEPA
jgi:hypothetical protein